MHYSDKDILIALKNGDDDKVLTFLYKEVLPKVKYYINKNKGNNEEAKDIFQDAVIIFYKKVKRDEINEETNIIGYICLISKNLWINRVKKINKTIDIGEEERHIADESFLEELISEEKKTTINALLDKIGEECKKLLKLSVYDNKSMKEICEIMAYSSENVAKTYNYRCKQKLIKLVMEKKEIIKILKE